MLAVSTLRLDSIPKEGAGAPYDHTFEYPKNGTGLVIFSPLAVDRGTDASKTV